MESGKILIEDDVKKNKNEKSISIAHLERSTKIDSNSDMRKKVFLETQKPEDKIDSQFQLKREDLRLNKRSNLLISERDIKKFVGGDEIIDKKNPFRKNGDHAVKNELYIDEEDFKPKSRIKINDDDFISTEEVLKQSKFVPVYIKNPDRVLTYDKSLLRDLKNVKLQAKPVKSSNRRTPLPTPRKKVEVNAKESRFIKKNFSNISSEYPKIKVKVGTELDESLHDPNEVIINALKFDKIFRKMQSEQTENLDDLDLFEEQDHHDKSKDDIDASQEMNDLGNEEKSYTNIISSNEFREYLKEKGLRLSTTFPTRFKKSSESKNDIPKETKNISNNTATELKVNVPCDEMSRNEKTDKKKTVFERFSKIFTKNRNIPSSDKVMLRNSSFNEKSFVKSKSDIRRRSTTQAYDGSVVVNNEFMTSNVNQPKENHRMNPNKVYPESKYDTIIRRSAPYSQPIHSTRVYSSTPTKQLSRESSNYYKQQPNGNVYKPTSRKSSFQHSDSSHFNDHLEVDPFLYAKIHEMKKQADEVLLKKTSNQQILPIKVPESHNNNESIENPCYGEVMYYNPNGNHFNVMMRRTESSSLSKKQIMEKIYEYYKKNTQTPEHDQTNLSSASKAEKNSHNIYSSFSHGNNSDASLFRRQLNADYDFPISRPETSHSKRTITNTLDRSSQRLSDKELGGIYDVVYESTPNNYELETNRNKDFYARPQSKVGTIRKVTSPSPVRNQIDFVDIVYNNIIYRPIATIKENEVSPICDTPKLKQYEHLPIRKQISTTKTDENCSIKNVRQSFVDDDFQHDKSNRNQIIDQVNDERNRRPTGRREDRERDIRRHTLGADMLLYGNQNMNQRSMDMEMNQSQKNRKGVAIRGYTPQSQGPLFDDDPGIMSEVETASTGFRRGGKQRSSLPVVRTPSKTLERPLGLVFLQYRSETKRALLPNEITSIDTVRALFVRSFPRQLSMAYLEGPNVKIYIHDSNKDMFYELEDMRSHLREIKDRSVLRLFESNEVTATPQILSGSAGIPQSLPQQGNIHWDQDPSYFSEPEFDSEYQHQHIHKSKTGKAAPYYVSAAQTLPRGHVYNDRSKSSMNMPSKPLRSYGSRGSLGHFSYPSEQLYNLSDGYMSSPERGNRAYEEPYYTPYCGARDNIAPTIIDEEQNDSLSADDQYSLYNAKIPNRITRNPNQMYDIARPDELHRIRVEHMERQLANLTGLVQKALVQNPTVTPAANQQQYTGVEGSFKNANGVLDDMSIRERPPKLGKSYKSVSFEKSVSFSDDIQGFPKAHNPQMATESKPAKPAIKSSTLPRTSSQERDRLKPIPPLKNKTSSNQYHADLTIAPDVYNHLRNLQKKARDMKIEIKTLRRLSQSQTIAVREDINDTFMRIRATLLATSGNQWGQFNQERTKISREEEIYKQEVIRLEKDLADLEASVEVLRGEVINRRTRVNMTAVEDMALVLSRASKTVAELKMKFPNLQQNLRSILADEMETFCREETFLKDEPDRLETALRRCKKLTGTLVTLKRLASVQEQRTIVEPTPPETSQNATNETLYVTSKSNAAKPFGVPQIVSNVPVPENALDALLDELQTFARPSLENEPNFDDSAASDEGSKLQSTVSTKLPQIQFYPEPMSTTTHGLRRLHSYPSGSDTDQDNEKISTGKPPLPERNSELLLRYGQKKLPPPPPPRTSSNRSPLESPTSPSMVLKASEQQNMFNSGNSKGNIQNDPDSGSESNNSQDNSSQRQMQLENRHKELLKKQKQLQEQYQRLQQLNKSSIPLISNDANANAPKGNSENSEKTSENIIMHPQSSVSTNKVYETDIL